MIDVTVSTSEETEQKDTENQDRSTGHSSRNQEHPSQGLPTGVGLVVVSGCQAAVGGQQPGALG